MSRFLKFKLNKVGVISMALSAFLLFSQLQSVFLLSNGKLANDIPLEVHSAIASGPIELMNQYQLDNFPHKTGSGTAGDPYIIENIEINAAGSRGIRVYGLDYYFIFRDINITNIGQDGIEIGLSSNIVITQVEITGGSRGIYVYESSNVKVSICKISGPIMTGILSFDCVGLEIEHSTINNCGGEGISIYNSDGSQVGPFNSIYDNQYGVYIGNSSHNIVENNNIVSNDHAGLVFAQLSNQNRIIGNNFATNGVSMGYNIAFLYNSSHNFISMNAFAGSNDNIYSSESHYNLFLNNSITGAYAASIFLSGNSTNNRICGNTIERHVSGVVIHSSDNNVVSGNNISGYSNNGVSLTGASDNLVAGNNITDCGGDWIKDSAVIMSTFDTGTEILNPTGNEIILNLLSNSENAVVFPISWDDDNTVEGNWIWGMVYGNFTEFVGSPVDIWPDNNFSAPTDPLWDQYDTDNDGLTHLEEFLLGSHPLKNDTDSDGISDGVEVNTHGTDPFLLDTDVDGLNDSYELGQSYDPLDPDMDSDGLLDGEELDLGTDPEIADYDSDGLNDGDEVEIGTDPFEEDSDFDGLLDGEEVDMGTKPLNNDTDSDGLSDGDEIDYGADPLEEDSDWDGLLDGEEVHEYGTDPVDQDTDGDYYSDYDEIFVEGSDPLDPDDPAPASIFDEIGWTPGVLIACSLLGIGLIIRKKKFLIKN